MKERNTPVEHENNRAETLCEQFAIVKAPALVIPFIPRDANLSLREQHICQHASRHDMLPEVEARSGHRWVNQVGICVVCRS